MNPAELPPQQAAGAMRVFVVEDSPAVRERLQAMLGEIEGTQTVGVAAGAQSAIEGIRAAGPDLVLLDLHLAEGNGFDVLRALRAPGAPTASVEVFVLSNLSAVPYRRNAQRLGVQGFFDKSTEFGRMRAALAARARSIRSERMH
jgi:DNA-binding NarL/FixJ family response regulator